MFPVYLFPEARVISQDASEFLSALEGAHLQKYRPLCTCRDPGPEMYVAKIGETYCIKRMPNTGHLHASMCESFDPPPGISGFSDTGSAIQENTEDGTVSLKLGFTLSKIGSRPAPTPGSAVKDSVSTDGNKLTTGQLLRYLWDDAKFNKWSPNMEGRRSWGVIRKHLLRSAANKLTKSSKLSEALVIPETFIAENKTEIQQRFTMQVHSITKPTQGRRNLALVLGEVKEIEETRYGYKAVLKHLPDYRNHFMMNKDIHRRMLSRFETELGLWNAFPGTHLILMGTFGVGSGGYLSLEEAALMLTEEHWIPFENTGEKALLDVLTKQSRHFSKCIRINLPSSKPLASAVLNDTKPTPTALFVISIEAEDGQAGAVEMLIKESDLPVWTWNESEGNMPEIPAPTFLVEVPPC